MTHTAKRSLVVALLLVAAAGCGAEISGGSTPEDVVDSRATESSPLQWWNSYITYSHISSGWVDTDLGVGSGTPVQLRHASRLYRHGVYGWGYMPEFVDTVTGYKFRFLHLRPQHQYATRDGDVYPAGYIVGLSGGDTRDTGLGVYSTGAHLCVQTLSSYRTAFPAGSDGGTGPSSGGGSCHSATLNRAVAAGTCVQSASDGQWYHCSGSSWAHGRVNCGISYGWCHSATLNRDVAPRSCVQARSDHVWYQCDAAGWESPVTNGAGKLGYCSTEYAL